MTTPPRIVAPKAVEVRWDGQTYPGGLSESGGRSRLAIRTNRSLIVGVVLEVDGERVAVRTLERSLTAGFRVATIEFVEAAE